MNLTRHQYNTLIDGRLDAMWARYKDSDSLDLLTAMRRNQQAGRYLIAGDIAAIRAALERGQTVKDIGRNALRKLLEDRFEWVAYEQSQGRA